MLTQATILKGFLKEMSLTDRWDRLSVTTERLYAGKALSGRSQYEHGRAVSHVASLTPDQMSELKAKSKHIEIYNNKELGFAIVKY